MFDRMFRTAGGYNAPAQHDDETDGQADELDELDAELAAEAGASPGENPMPARSKRTGRFLKRGSKAKGKKAKGKRKAAKKGARKGARASGGSSAVKALAARVAKLEANQKVQYGFNLAVANAVRGIYGKPQVKSLPGFAYQGRASSSIRALPSGR